MIYYWPISLAAWALGIAVGFYRQWPLLLAILFILLLVGLARMPLQPYVILVMVTLLLGASYENVIALRLTEDLRAWPGATFQGRIIDFPSYDQGKTTFTLQTDSSSAYLHKLRVVCLFPVNLNRGDNLSVEGDLKVPEEPGNPGEFDFPTYLAHQGIYYNLAVTKPADFTAVQPGRGIVHGLDMFRLRGQRLISDKLNPDEASVLLGMILGGRSDIEDSQYQDFQKVGIVHLFSVGGLHAALLLALSGWIGWLLGWSKMSQCGAGIILLLLYGTTVGWPPPVVRAVVMAVAASLAYYSGRRSGLLNAWAMAGWVILLLNPEFLFNISFQLTMLATWGLVYLFPRFRKALPKRSWVFDIVLLPLAAELAVLPLVAYYFNLLNPVSILTNILITYLASGAVVLGFIAFGMCSWPLLSGLFLYPAGWLIELIIWVTAQVKLLPGAYFWVAPPSIAIIIIYFLALTCLAYSLGNNRLEKYRLPAALLVIVSVGSLLTPTSWYQPPRLEIVFLDVGQGDAILLKSPGGKYVLVDGGGSAFYDVGSKVVLPYLHYCGINQLDMIINTHPDVDHLQGLSSVAAETRFETIGLPQCLMNCSQYQPLLNWAAQYKASLIPLRKGQSIVVEPELAIKVLYPGESMPEGAQYNQYSLVLQVKYRDFTALLCGDVPAAGLDELKVGLPPATVVKVPHHGSRGSLSPAFYAALSAREAVISVGADNSFGHPHPALLKTLEEQDIRIWRTDQEGAVIVSSNGWTYDVQTFKPVAGHDTDH